MVLSRERKLRTSSCFLVAFCVVDIQVLMPRGLTSLQRYHNVIIFPVLIINNIPFNQRGYHLHIYIDHVDCVMCKVPTRRNYMPARWSVFGRTGD